MEKVRNTGKYQYYYDNNTTAEERNKRKASWEHIKNANDTISLKLSNYGDSVSICFMRDFLQYDIQTGVATDVKNDGFSTTDQLNLAKEFEKIFKEHNYSTDFKRMQQYNPKTSTNGKGMYEITYSDYVRLAKAAGYKICDISIEPLQKLPEIIGQVTQNTVPKLQMPVNLNVKSTAKVNTSSDTTKPVGKITENEFIAIFESDEELKDKTNEERLEIIKQRISVLKKEKNSIDQPQYTYVKSGFLGLGKKIRTEVSLTEDEQAIKAQAVEKIQLNLDKAEKIKVYLEELTNKYWRGVTLATVEGKNTDGEIIAYPRVQKVQYEYPDGRKIRALREDIYNTYTHEYEYKYYPISVDKVSNDYAENYPTFYRVVPDLENELP